MYTHLLKTAVSFISKEWITGNFAFDIMHLCKKCLVKVSICHALVSALWEQFIQAPSGSVHTAADEGEFLLFSLCSFGPCISQTQKQKAILKMKGELLIGLKSPGIFLYHIPKYILAHRLLRLSTDLLTPIEFADCGLCYITITAKCLFTLFFSARFKSMDLKAGPKTSSWNLETPRYRFPYHSPSLATACHSTP